MTEPGTNFQNAPIFQKFGDGLWLFDYPIKLAGMNMGSRTTVWKLESGGLALHSPGCLTDEQRSTIDSLGAVELLIAPNLMHHLYLESSRKYWPNAKIWVPEGLDIKLPELPIDHVMEASGDITNIAQWVKVDGMPRVNEYVFLHHPSKTLILTDICFNYRNHPQWWLRTFMRMNNAYGKLTPSRLMKSMISSPDDVRIAIDLIMDWDWNAIVLPHGEPVRENARDQFREAFSFLY